jgi:hypothetical protein
MLGRCVEVEQEAWQLHDSEVDHQVPEHHRVVIDEGLTGENLVSFFAESVDEFLV